MITSNYGYRKSQATPINYDLQLLNMMFSFKQKNKYNNEGARVTRSIDRFVCDTDIVQKDIYARSPYFCVAFLFVTVYQWSIRIYLIVVHLRTNI